MTDTGCPSIDALSIQYPINEPVPRENNHADGNYIISIFHPHTCELYEASAQTKIMISEIRKLQQLHNFKLFWFASNNDPGSQYVRSALADVKLITNLIGREFIELLAGAKMIVGNSSAAIREASFLGVPAINIGKRQNGRDTANNVFHCDFPDIYETMKSAWSANPRRSIMFGDGNACERIVKNIKQWWKHEREAKTKKTA